MIVRTAKAAATVVGCPFRLPVLWFLLGVLTTLTAQQQQDLCTLCPTADDTMVYPDRAINIPDNNPYVGVSTCGELQGMVAVTGFATDSAECGFFRLLAVYCGCPRQENACPLCPMQPIEQQEQDDGTTILVPTFITTPDRVQAELQQQQQQQQQEQSAAQEEEDEYRFDFLVPLLGWSPNCAQMESIAATSTAGTDDCDLTQLLVVECTCSGDVDTRTSSPHFGANNQRQENVILALPKFSAVLSLIGSALIVRDVLFGNHSNNNNNSRSSRSLQTYQVIMLAMSVFDILGCLAWSLSQHAVPEGFKPGSMGTMGTCRAAAFFTQLSFTATFYNVCLCLYYYLTITRGFRERDFGRIKYAIYLVPPALGLTLAAAGWNKYSPFSIWGCYFPIPPIAESYRNIYLFAIAPVGTAVLLCTSLMAMICWDVRQKVLRSMQWTMARADSRDYNYASGITTAAVVTEAPRSSVNDGNISSRPLPEANEGDPTTATTQTGGNGVLATAAASTTATSAMQQQQQRRSSSRRPMTTRPPRADHDVFWQSVFYLGALYVCWPILLYSFSIKHYSKKYYVFHVVFFVCAPLQGFLNALVYFRPRFIRYWRDRRREQQQQRQRSTRNGHQEMPSPLNSKTESTITTVEQSAALMAKKIASVQEAPEAAVVEEGRDAP